MEEFNENDIKQYTNGFNQGYEFASALPSVTSTMFQNMPEAVKEKPQMKGILDGIGQKNKERYLDRKKAVVPEKTTTPPKEKPSPDLDR